ncbi:uroporphyrin-III C-methyltransferase [Pisolithus orientalis]|uniref:uroporphyrin-III C-methyltransferase n=1 Tax=Pisolithus orientalis TaxID=936130 RepID=UPI0022242AA6|nr:uroporphyrin-III C-methyltransferase [Pisolithus orientalis]KAI6012791.1 uroporphyrin-III C-methyltransferase [Pisolithus orientalis]
MEPFSPFTGGASLLLSFRVQKKTVLVIGGDALAASRAYVSLEADANVVVLVRGGLQAVCDELQWRARQGQVSVLDWGTLLSDSRMDNVGALEGVSSPRTPSISLVCVTGTLSPSFSSRTRILAPHIARVCRAYRIPHSATFTSLSTHRFVDPTTGAKSSMQLGVTANGEGCRLVSRIRREAVAALPKELGGAVTASREQERKAEGAGAVDEKNDVDLDTEGENGDAEDTSVNTPNQPVPIRRADEPESVAEAVKRRMRWVAQVSEYWPISRLSALKEPEMRVVLSGSIGLPSVGQNNHGESSSSQSLPPLQMELRSQHGLKSISPISSKKEGRILLVGSGPGHPSLLTLATHNALTKHADLVLSDKLVPSAVLELIPQHVELRIARKFPGNADGAQTEMMEAAVEAARRGLTVVRLKQGDPVVYGRAGEEVLYFRSHGFEPLVVPGVSSALAAPTFAGIPVTQLCTGVGRQGKEVRLPGYERSRTLLILMGVARLTEVVGALLGCSPFNTTSEGDSKGDGRRDGSPYPPTTPIAIIERGSMPDQRVLVSTLADVCTALESLGAQRPPGMIVVGWAVLALHGHGDVRVLEEGEGGDEERVKRWLGGRRWNVIEGISEGWAAL